MPLPKAPNKPATLLSITDSPLKPSAPVAKAKLQVIAAPPEPAQARVKAPAPAAPPPARAAKTVPAPASVQVSKTTRRKREDDGVKKLFVLDTNVLMHDPSSLFRFEEHDVYLPIMTLEELDNHKKGMSEVSRNARQVSRTMDALLESAGQHHVIEEGLSLSSLGNKDATGRLYFQTQVLPNLLPSGLPTGKADNQILSVVRALQESRSDRRIVLVSKDINMRIKARALGLPAEDYFNDHVLEDTDLLYAGWLALPPDFWSKHGKGVESWQQQGSTFYRITGPVVPYLLINQFVYFEGKDGEASLYAQVRELNGKTAVLQTLRDYTHNKNAVWGITARNREQNFALNLLMNPECDFVSLLGQAGTGKTLLALAAGLSQALDTRRYTEIIVTRATVPVGEDIGFLPGTEEEKMAPWMGAFDDNLEVLMGGAAGTSLTGNNGHAGADWGRQAGADLIRSKIKIKSMNFMRGRTFVNKFLIIDEAQNLTPKQMKTLITRAGPGTKVVCLGNIAQIDTPYLSEGSSGLTYVVDRFKGWPHAGHITLARGERSRLADFAAEAL
ncbi:MAG: PhoH family protein [Burkholderiales bacterium]|nr:PhoH family protein [Burkholderiales bacterium]MCA3161760.1 PhoH family protein [Burkholderiales bacterium]MCA3164315.1 PhoH family protein [Burkholderiales bacterium]MCA3165396.1 PhoH family protein [Burkholderiales bacterium]MCA3170539.1 PhoH family protein [Burkholderiales bacterium]